MSSQAVLKFVAGRKPIFDMEYAILSAPVRHIFMIATIWFLTQKNKRADLHILEIGSWMGASALSFAQGLKVHNGGLGSITCIDAWRPFFDRSKHQNDVYQNMEQALSTETAYQIFNHNISTLPQEIICQHLRGQSESLLPLLRDEIFDVVFIDADHAYTPVIRDIKHSLNLIKEGGIICGDDLNLQRHEVDQTFLNQHVEMDFINDPKTKRNYHPGVTLAVAEIFGEVSAWGGFWAMQKRNGVWHKISLKEMPIHYPEHFPPSALHKAQDHLNDITIT